jgi:hypothetical protein
MDLDIVNNYIDNILNKYTNLGHMPCVSLLSVYKTDNNLLVNIMFSSLKMKECIKSHIKNCQCADILYEKFIISPDLSVYSNNNKTSLYLNDLGDIVLQIIKKFYL